MSIHVFALLIGIVAGLRAMTATAVVSWAAHLGWLQLENTPLAYLGSGFLPYFFTLLAIAELIADKLSKTPSRKELLPFITRIVSGALCGAALGAQHDALTGGLVAGTIGSVIGTLGGYAVRVRLAAANGGKDRPIAFLEDAIAIGGAILVAAAAT
ncbi:MAG: DUF4126 family protein [Pseudomonadota bacterium]